MKFAPVDAMVSYYIMTELSFTFPLQIHYEYDYHSFNEGRRVNSEARVEPLLFVSGVRRGKCPSAGTLDR